MQETNDRQFVGNIPAIYDAYLVPLIFQPCADDLAVRVAASSPRRVLEIAAGTGVVTRRLAAVLPAPTEIVATDLNPAMLEAARAAGTTRPVEWQQADGMKLPFSDGAFDAVACQFGAMFFSDRVHAFGEARRVLAPGGLYAFNVWDRIETNDFADDVIAAMAKLFPEDPPRFLARTPHGHHDTALITDELVRAGFPAAAITVEPIEARSRAASARIPAIAYCQGTPLRNEIEARDATKMGAAIDAAEAAIAARFGNREVDGRIRAYVFTAMR